MSSKERRTLREVLNTVEFLEPTEPTLEVNIVDSVSAFRLALDTAHGTEASSWRPRTTTALNDWSLRSHRKLEKKNAQANWQVDCKQTADRRAYTRMDRTTRQPIQKTSMKSRNWMQITATRPLEGSSKNVFRSFTMKPERTFASHPRANCLRS